MSRHLAHNQDFEFHDKTKEGSEDSELAEKQEVDTTNNERRDADEDLDFDMDKAVADDDAVLRKSEATKLLKMSLATAVAIALHNFPEGLATYVLAMGDLHVGAILAFGIAMHNIPEGLCISLPVYYATGSRWQGFGWAALSAASEPLGGLMGYAVLETRMGPNAFGILYGLIAGMMVVISISEILPTAHRYDPSGRYVIIFFVLGMLLIALSLVVFGYS